MSDPKQLAAEERSDFADLLDTLGPGQWAAPSLCEGWTVREVAAHVVSYESLGLLGAMRLMARHGFDLDRTNAARLREVGAWQREHIISELRAHLRPSGVTAMFGGRLGLTDCTIHHQDVRRALHLPRDIPPDRLRAVLDFMPRARALPAPRLVRGLRLIATDIDWSRGEGPEVSGPAESLMVALAGRTASLEELSGDGIPELRRRIAG